MVIKTVVGRAVYIAQKIPQLFLASFSHIIIIITILMGCVLFQVE